MKSSLCLLPVLFLFAVASPAETLTFIASGPTALGISPLNENPPHPESHASGSALITWDTVTNVMTVNATFAGLTTGNTAAHIHCCIDAPGNAGVATTVPTFTGFPTGATSGTYSHAFDMLSSTSYNPAFITANGGTAASAAAVLLAGIRAGRAYLNIHTSTFPGGEMRGFTVKPVDIAIKPDADAPVPINPKSRGRTPVAILSTATFNATTAADTSTLRFGRTGNEQSIALCHSGGEDVNNDGLLDLVCQVFTDLTGFQSGDTLGILKGKTVSGTPILGQQAIVTRP